jgi:hypothetical protein
MNREGIPGFLAFSFLPLSVAAPPRRKLRANKSEYPSRPSWLNLFVAFVLSVIFVV